MLSIRNQPKGDLPHITYQQDKTTKMFSMEKNIQNCLYSIIYVPCVAVTLCLDFQIFICRSMVLKCPYLEIFQIWPDMTLKDLL